MYGALLLAVYDPAGDQFQTICKCGTGFSDAELAALTARLALSPGTRRPAQVDSRADVWFEPTLVVEVLAAELTVIAAPHRRLGPAQGGRRRAGPPVPPLHRRAPRTRPYYDATTVAEVVEMFRTARRAPTSS